MAIEQTVSEQHLDSNHAGPPILSSSLEMVRQACVPSIAASSTGAGNRFPHLAANVAEPIDISSSSSDVEIVASSDDEQPLTVGQAATIFASPLQFWIDKIGNRMVQAHRFVEANSNRVSWRLPLLRQNIIEWTITHIEDILAQQYVKSFYIGITARLEQRWSGGPGIKGHKNDGWQRMYLLAVSDDPDEIGDAEKSVIGRFRRWGRHGYFNPDGHRLCMNRNPGAEGARGGEAPHILYVVWKWNPRHLG